MMTDKTAARMSALGMAILPIRITALAQSDGNGRTAPPQSWIQKLGTQVLIPRAAIIRYTFKAFFWRMGR